VTGPTNHAQATPDRRGETAGFVTRGIAFALDAVIVAVAFNLTLAGTVFILSLLFGKNLSDVSVEPIVLTASFLGWSLVYSWFGLAAFGRTAGKGLMGLRVVRRDDGNLGVLHSLVRAVVAPVMQTVTFGVDVLWILVSSRRLALHDIVLRTKVVYAWEARAARPLLALRRGDETTPPPTA
jgi:uncharacterized RDD family membrane protein YckC